MPQLSLSPSPQSSELAMQLQLTSPGELDFVAPPIAGILRCTRRLYRTEPGPI